jgi:hypothetical protein
MGIGTIRHMKPTSPLVIAIVGMLSLAVAMGIGRFAFTPLLPMMLHDGVIDLSAATRLATANYLGYWLGAMACALQPWVWTRLMMLPPVVHATAMRLGLGLTVVLTLGMALHFPGVWTLLRLFAGIASALVFVYTSGWCLARLADAGAPQLGGVIFVGPGLGIAVSGFATTAMVAAGASASTGWTAMAILAALLTAFVWPKVRGVVTIAPPPIGFSQASGGAMAMLAVAYGLAGFGYIVTATFLPVIARQTLPGSVWLDLFWPLFGLGVAAGALITIRFPAGWDRRHLLMGCYALQAIGIMLGVWWPSLAGFALGSLLVGLPFTAITLFAMQEVRRVRPLGVSSGIGLLTAVYGLGQIAGPPWVAVMLDHSATTGQGFNWSLETAAGSLLLGIALYAWLIKKHPAYSMNQTA